MNAFEPTVFSRESTLCFSGHRSYVPSHGETIRLARAVRAARDAGFRTFITGMAPGFDLAAAEAVVRMRERICEGVRDAADGVVCDAAANDVRLVAAVPFAGQTRGYSEHDLERYNRLLAAADEVKVLADRYSHGCYYRRDDWMVDRAARIVCWYDPSRGASGTRYTVRRAVRAGLEVVNLFRDPAGELLF